jgi:uncharacterized Zn finger protein
MSATVVHLPAARSLGTVDVAVLADQRTYRRGLAYLREGRVTDVDHRGGRLTANVTGSEAYLVELWFGASGLEHRCTCPVGTDGGFCKHLVAVALAVAPTQDWTAEVNHVIDAAEQLLQTGHAPEVASFCDKAVDCLEQNRAELGDDAKVGQLTDRLSALRRRAHPSTGALRNQPPRLRLV